MKKEAAPIVGQQPALEQNERPEMSERAWRISSAAILLTSAVCRLYDLRLVPAHHDEGVNGNFLLGLVRNRTYQYDPHNYHGPTLYYFAAIIPRLYGFFGGTSFRDAHGLTTFNIRFVTAAFGIATVWLALLLRKRIGAIGALSAAALIAISPGAVYFSRYFIHEMLFVFFTAGIVVAALKYYDTARPLYLVLASASAALMTATKETWIISGPVLLIALVTTETYVWLRQRPAKQARKWKRAIIEPQEKPTEQIRRALERFGGASTVAFYALVAIVIFIFVNVLFYSSFFTNAKGVKDALSTLNLWSQRTHEHGHPWWQYLEWLWEEESPLLILGGVGALVAVWRADNRFALFAAQWAFGTLAAYSLVEYKTPWNALNVIIPLAITGGYTLAVVYSELRRFQQARLLIGLAALIVAIAGYQMYSLNFVHYDDDHYAYVYAHTRRDLLVMLDEIDRVARKNGTGPDTAIQIAAPEYWPLPWYLRDYKHIGGYSGHVTSSDDAVIIASAGQEAEAKATLDDRYQLINSGLPNGNYSQQPGVAYSLRPGVDFLLYVRRDLAR